MLSKYSNEYYCLSEDGRFVQRRLGEELLLFDQYSGETHLIGLPALYIIDFLTTETLDVISLRSRLQDVFDESDDEIGLFLEQTLHELIGIGVIKTS